MTKRLLSATLCILLLSSVFMFSEAFSSNGVGKRGVKVSLHEKSSEFPKAVSIVVDFAAST